MRELRNSRCSSWIYKRQRNQRSNCQHPLLDHGKSKRIPEKHLALLTMVKPLTVWITINCGKFWKRWKYQTTWPAFWEICMQVKKQQLELVATTDWFQTGKGVCQGCILSPCLFNLYAEYIMWNAGLDEAQAGIKIARRNVDNLKYADDIPLWQKVKRN